ncbi:MAG: glycosyl hydrolase family 28-related protein [Nitrospirota bacterium]
MSIKKILILLVVSLAPALNGNCAMAQGTAPGNGIFDIRSFGAKGDGVSDDTKAIQNAANAIPDAGGKLYIPRGIFIVRNVSLKSGTTVTGEGADSVLKLPPSATSGGILTVSYKNNITVRDVAFDGSDTGRTTSGHSTACFWVQAAAGDVTVENCSFRNNTECSSCVRIDSPIGKTSHDITISHCLFENVDVGVITYGCRDVCVNQCTYRGTSEGISFWHDSGFEGNYSCFATDNIIEDTGGSAKGIVFGFCDTFEASGNRISNTGKGGIAFWGPCKNGEITENTISDFGRANDCGGIEDMNWNGIQDVLEDITITDNTIEDYIGWQGKGSVGKGFSFWGTGAKNGLVIEHNRLAHTGHYGIYFEGNAGANTIRDNTFINIPVELNQ